MRAEAFDAREALAQTEAPTGARGSTAVSHAAWRPIDVFFAVMLGAVWLAGLLQAGRLGRDADNLISVASTVLSSSLMLLYIWRSNALVTHPVSSLALLGMSVTSQTASLLIQTMELTSFTRWLRAPVLTFGLLAMLHVVAVLTHWSYRHLTSLQSFTQGVAQLVWSPLGILKVPPVHVVWLLSLMGLGSFLGGGGATGDVGGKFIAAVSFLMWLPFMIPLYQQLQGGRYCDLRKHVPLIMAYGLLIAAVAIVRNFRQLMFIGPIQGLFVYLLYVARSERPATSATFWRLIFSIAFLAFSVWVVSDLVTAMSMMRDKRDKATPMEMLKGTAEAYMDKAGIQRAREDRLLDAVLNPYDETYLNNPTLARFSETKFHDNMFYLSQDLSASEVGELREALGRHMLAVLPQNVLDLFDIPLDKNENMFSMGDMHLHLLTGSPLGSYVTGSLWADVYALTGPFMPFVAALLMLVTFILLDSLTRLDGDHFISPAVLCATWPIFVYGLGGESLAQKVSLLARDVPQRALLYALALALVTMMLGLVGKGSRQPGSSAPKA